MMYKKKQPAETCPLRRECFSRVGDGNNRGISRNSIYDGRLQIPSANGIFSRPDYLIVFISIFDLCPSEILTFWDVCIPHDNGEAVHE